MTLGQLISISDISLKSKTRVFCERGLKMMKRSTDPAHNIRHIERMFADLGRFLDENKEFRVDFETLLISISWHDVWRAMNFKPDLSLILDSIIEGREAAKLVSKEMEKNGFEKELIEKVVYCVERHTGSEPDPVKRQSIESRILHDLDQMDSWSEGRLQEIKDYLLKSFRGRFFLSLLKTGIGKRSILKAADYKYYFQSSQKVRDERYLSFPKIVEELFG